VKTSASKPLYVIFAVVNVSGQGMARSIPTIRMTGESGDRFELRGQLTNSGLPGKLL